jgi:hypothetical protein
MSANPGERWTATEDASNLRAESSDDALNELYSTRDDWPDDNTPTHAEVDADDFDWERERWRGWTS